MDARPVLFLKAHVRGYTKKDGTFVAPHEDKRKAAKPAQLGLTLREETGGDQVIGYPYASGMSRKRDMAAAIESPAGLGTVIQELSDAGMDRIADAVAEGKPVFVDSGAFPAFKAAMKAGRPQDARLDFEKVFAKYNELSRRVCERADYMDRSLLMIVAPDVVGDQVATLELVEQHRDQIMDWIEAGHEVIVPFQRGPVDQYVAYLRVRDALEDLPFVVGIPSAAEALSTADLVQLLGHDYKPSRLHILGAVQSKRWEERMSVIREQYVDDVPGVTADANVMRSKLHELGGMVGEEKFEKIKDILTRVVPEHYGGTRPLAKAGLDEPEVEVVTGSFVPVSVHGKGWEPPTEAQQKAGNYFKPSIKWRGLVLKIENPAGSVRTWRNPDGSTGAHMLWSDYGYAANSTGVDGDEVDVIIGPNLLSCDTVWVVHQRKAGDWKAYDEDKSMVGFMSEGAARTAFLMNYNDPRFLGPITAMPVDEFVEKVKATKEKPAMIKALFFLKAKSRSDTQTPDMFGTHVEQHVRTDGVTQNYHVSSSQHFRTLARNRPNWVRDELHRRLLASGDDYEIRDIPHGDAKPIQTGEDYLNDSSRETARRIKSGEVLETRAEDVLPIRLNRDGKIVDGHHRHAAAGINGESSMLAMVPVGKGPGRIRNLHEFTGEEAPPKPPARRLIDELRESTFENPFDDSERVTERAGYQVSPAGDDRVHLHSIRSFERGQGHGSEALRHLTDLADKHGVTLEGVAEPFGQGGLKKKALGEWYKRHGFTVRNGEMTRKPGA